MKAKRPIFVARDGYRLRRIMDAARLLPVLGTFLILLPVLWAGGSTRGGFIYLFTVWLCLIAFAAVLSRRLSEPEGGTKDGPPVEPEDDPV